MPTDPEAAGGSDVDDSASEGGDDEGNRSFDDEPTEDMQVEPDGAEDVETARMKASTEAWLKSFCKSALLADPAAKERYPIANILDADLSRELEDAGKSQYAIYSDFTAPSMRVTAKVFGAEVDRLFGGSKPSSSFNVMVKLRRASVVKTRHKVGIALCTNGAELLEKLRAARTALELVVRAFEQAQASAAAQEGGAAADPAAPPAARAAADADSEEMTATKLAMFATKLARRLAALKQNC